VNGAVDVGSSPAYLATYRLRTSVDVSVGSTFEVTLVSPPTTKIQDSMGRSIPYAVAPACTLTVADCHPVQYGDVNYDGTVDLRDLLCVLDGFSGIVENCGFVDVDIEPCGGDGEVTLTDVLAVLDAFAHSPAPCPDPCVPTP